MGVTDEKSSAVDDIGSKDRVAINTKVTTKTTAIDVPATEMEVQEGVSTSVQEKEESIHEFIARTCVWCARSRALGRIFPHGMTSEQTSGEEIENWSTR